MTTSEVDIARRVREVGMQSLADAELLALVVHGAESFEASTRLALRLLAGRSLRELARAGPTTLARTLHVSPLVATRVASAVEIGKRIAQEVNALPARIADSAEVYAWAKPRLIALEHEELWILSLDGRNNVRSQKRVCAGGSHGLSVTAKEVLRHALIEGASAFVLVHNHPSGNPEPSPLDIRFTEHVITAGAELELPLLDHVVVARSGYESIVTACFRG